jgi:hypothetical protein
VQRAGGIAGVGGGPDGAADSGSERVPRTEGIAGKDAAAQGDHAVVCCLTDLQRDDEPDEPSSHFSISLFLYFLAELIMLQFIILMTDHLVYIR